MRAIPYTRCKRYRMAHGFRVVSASRTLIYIIMQRTRNAPRRRLSPSKFEGRARLETLGVFSASQSTLDGRRT
jgi:hypothetical protein